jgi:hypothetical protein
LSQLLTLYTTPVVYLYLDKLGTALSRRDRSPEIKDIPRTSEAEAAE